MKKVKIITFHPGLNYGAVLQAFALMKIIGQLHFDVQIIDYRPFALMKKYYRFMVKPKTLIARLVQHYHFALFRKNHLNLTETRYRSYKQLKQKGVDADYLICGSDQVWNTAIFKQTDPAYFLAFAKSNQKKIAYAASLGANPFPEHDKLFIKNEICSYYKLSVREIFAKKQVEKLINKSPQIVLDPTLLFDNFSLFVKNPARMPEKYILVYAIEYSSFLKENVKKARNILKIPVVNISPWIFTGADYNRIGISPNTWLGWFKNATYVVTNSFHGTAFSLIFNKNFSFISIEKARGLNNRIVDLLEAINSSDRIVHLNKDEILLKNIDEQMDYAKIVPELEKLKEKSLDFIKTALDYNEK